MADIESGRDQRPCPEFSIEYVSSWKREIVDGQEVVMCMECEGRYITVYPDDETKPGGWFVLFREDEDGYALTLDDHPDCPFVEGSCCGGPLEVRAGISLLLLQRIGVASRVDTKLRITQGPAKRTMRKGLTCRPSYWPNDCLQRTEDT